MPAAIQIDQLHKRYDQLHALKGIDLTIEEGEFFGLLGPNGAGKSTLISILAGLTRLDSGSAAVMGFDVVRDYRQARHHLGVVPQELVFDPFFSVREILEIQAGYFGKSIQEVSDWIDRLLEGLKLSDKASANMRTLSGGMKRRVLIAQALVHKPPVVILDEPTAGVDVELRSSLWQFVKTLHQEGHTIVLTTHYLEEAEQLCDRIGIINHGELIALESKDDLLAKGARGGVLHLTLARAIDSWPAGWANRVSQANSQTPAIQFDRGRESVIDLLDQVRDAGAEIIDIQIEEPDLEDVFIELTRGR